MRHWGYILLIFFFIGCNTDDDPTKKELIALEIEKRVHNYYKSKARECREESLEIAIRQTDSLLKLNAVRYREDSLQRPPLPPKPTILLRPAPKDSVLNQPFLYRKPDSIPPDTLKIIE